MWSFGNITLLFAITFIAIGNAAKILPASNNADIIPDSYIVVLKEGLSSRDVDSHKGWIADIYGNNVVTRRTGSRAGGLNSEFNLFGMQGYSGKFDKQTIQRISERSDVKYIEHDSIVNARGLIVQDNATWNLARISHKGPSIPAEYVYDETAGEDIIVYLFDTGVDASNSGLQGRVMVGINTTPETDTDQNGHGTFVAEIIAGEVFGVAKKAKIVSVKVLGSSGGGSISGIIQGLDWSVTHADGEGVLGKSVINLSIGGSFSAALNDAVTNVAYAGIFVSAAVGSSNSDAGQDSPASAEGACAAAASTVDNTPASTANYGPVVDIYAPGQSITAKIHGDQTQTMSGSSLAAAHLSGVAAYFIRLNGVSSNELCGFIKDVAIPAINNPAPGTTNLLLYNNSGR